MPLFSFEGLSPTVHPDAFIAPTATLVGDVHVEAHASICYNAVVRADLGPIVVREGANVQDGCVLHGGEDPVTEIGAGATIGHLCVVHGCVIGPEAPHDSGTQGLTTRTLEPYCSFHARKTAVRLQGALVRPRFRARRPLPSSGGGSCPPGGLPFPPPLQGASRSPSAPGRPRG